MTMKNHIPGINKHYLFLTFLFTMLHVNISNAIDLSLPGAFPETAIWSGPYNTSSSLPLGKWNMIAAGRIYSLHIESVVGNAVTGKINSGNFTNGFWDNTAGIGKLTFLRELPTITQEFTAYLFPYDSKDPKYRLAGTFGNISIGTESGWYATKPREQK